jgi:hypothetical protein
VSSDLDCTSLVTNGGEYFLCILTYLYHFLWSICSKILYIKICCLSCKSSLSSGYKPFVRPYNTLPVFLEELSYHLSYHLSFLWYSLALCVKIFAYPSSREKSWEREREREREREMRDRQKGQVTTGSRARMWPHKQPLLTDLGTSDCSWPGCSWERLHPCTHLYMRVHASVGAYMYPGMKLPWSRVRLCSALQITTF